MIDYDKEVKYSIHLANRRIATIIREVINTGELDDFEARVESHIGIIRSMIRKIRERVVEDITA